MVDARYADFVSKDVLKCHWSHLDTLEDSEILSKGKPLHEILRSAAAEVGLAFAYIQNRRTREVHMQLRVRVVHLLQLARPVPS